MSEILKHLEIATSHTATYQLGYSRAKSESLTLTKAQKDLLITLVENELDLQKNKEDSCADIIELLAILTY